MANDDETTAKQLRELLANEGHTLSKSTILRTRRSLGWTYRGSSYCQLIREANKSKRLQWAMEYREEAAGDGFKDVLWTDESTVQLYRKSSKILLQKLFRLIKNTLCWKTSCVVRTV